MNFIKNINTLLNKLILTEYQIGGIVTYNRFLKHLGRDITATYENACI